MATNHLHYKYMESSRRRNVQESLGLTTQEEEQRQQSAIDKELQRQNKKAEKRRQLENDFDYKVVKGISVAFDGYFLDPIIGFLIPGAGDVLTSICAIPFIWVAAARVRSIPLTLAVIYNTMIDVALGLIPFYIGDIIDTFNRSYKKNYRLIVGYVEDDQEIISEVNRKAIRTAVLIAILCVIIYYLVKILLSVMATIWEWMDMAWQWVTNI